MANKLYQEAYIQDIANAIREKNEQSTSYKVSEMADAIRSLNVILEITFTINGTSYTVIKGTTWYEWANANGWNCSSGSDNVWDQNYDFRVHDKNGNAVSGADIILEQDYEMNI